MTITKKFPPSKEWKYTSVDEQWSSTDIGVATALLCSGFTLQSVDKGNPHKSLFIFNNEVGIEKTANQFFSNTLTVKAREFFDQLKALKNLIYN